MFKSPHIQRLYLLCIVALITSMASAQPEVSLLGAEIRKLTFATHQPCFEFPLSLVEFNGEYAGQVHFWHSWLRSSDGRSLELTPLEFHADDTPRCESGVYKGQRTDFSTPLIAHGRQELWLAGKLEEEGAYTLSVSLELELAGCSGHLM